MEVHRYKINQVSKTINVELVVLYLCVIDAHLKTHFSMGMSNKSSIIITHAVAACRLHTRVKFFVSRFTVLWVHHCVIEMDRQFQFNGHVWKMKRLCRKLLSFNPLSKFDYKTTVCALFGEGKHSKTGELIYES